jgi:hypothetical protein
MGQPEKPERKCLECKTNEPAHEHTMICKECMAKAYENDVCIGINSSVMNNDE